MALVGHCVRVWIHIYIVRVACLHSLYAIAGGLCVWLAFGRAGVPMVNATQRVDWTRVAVRKRTASCRYHFVTMKNHLSRQAREKPKQT